MTILDAAVAYCRAGLAVLPAHPTEKRPLAGKGRHGKNASFPSEAHVRAACVHAEAICILCGAVSGNVECIDFDDGGSAFAPWRARIHAAAPELLNRLVMEHSPSGGVHVVYRAAEPIPGSHRLAVNAAGKLLVETRGEGALFLCAPSPRYQLIQGQFTALPRISPAEREVLMAAARSFDAGLSCPSTANVPPGSPPSIMPPLPGAASPYAVQALAGEVDKVRTAPEGSRNRTLNNAALKIGHYVAAGHIAEEDVRRALEAAALEAGLSHGEIAATLRSGLSAGLREPKSPPPRTEGIDAPGAGADTGSDVGIESLVRQVEAFDRLGAEEEDDPFDDDGEDGDAEYVGLLEPLRAEWLDAPGFIHDAVEWGMAASLYPNRPLIFASVLATLATLTARKIMTGGLTRPNIYALGVGNSGVGKDTGNDIAGVILQHADLGHVLMNDFGSGEAIEDKLMEVPAILWLCDEIDAWLGGAKNENARGGTSEGKIRRMLSLFTASHKTIYRRGKARPAGERRRPAEGEREVVHQPHLSVYGTCTPKGFFSAFSERIAAGGFLGRMLIFDAAPRGRRNRRTASLARPPDRVVEIARFWANHPCGQGDLADVMPQPFDVPVTPAAEDIDWQHADEVDTKIYPESERRANDAACSIWARTGQYAQKLALLYAASADPERLVIDERAMDWGWRVSMTQSRRLVALLGRHGADTPFQAQCQRVLNRLREARGAVVGRSELLRLTRAKKSDFDAIIETLVERRQIQAVQASTRTNHKTGYQLRTRRK